MGQITVENGSSSSEQITLKPIGPSQRDFSSYRQWEHDNNSVNSRSQNMTSSGYGNYGNKPLPPERSTRNIQGQVQGSYKKIPKQEVDYTGNIRAGNANNKQSHFQGQQSGVARQQNMNYNQAKPSVVRSSNPPFYGSKDGHSDNEMSFQELKTKEPILLKKAIGRVEKKRKSHSDDSLDELIESNIQYLESEIESGRLKKMTSSQPGMFPTSGSDVKRTSDKEKRRSSSLDGVSKPAQSSFQNEVKLRLQIPSASRPSYRSNQYEGYDNRGDAMPQYSQTQQSVLRPHEILYQNTIPVERRFQSATHSPYLQRRSTAELANMEDMSKSDSQLNTNDYGLDLRRPMNYQNPQFPQSNVISRAPIVDMTSEHQTVIQNYSVCPGIESGMFSDVDYDIEVSERVKKWEKLMKKKTDDPGGDKKGGAVSLTTILESEGGVPDGWLPGHSVSPSVALSSVTVTVTKSTTHMEPPSESSSHRMFHVIQQPDSSKPPESTVTYIRSPPFVDNPHQSSHLIEHQFSDYTNNDAMSAKQSWPPVDQELSAKDQQKLARLSKYEEELNEIQVLKMDSVKDLRRRFDSDASGNESTDTKEVVTPIRLTPLRKRRHLVKSFEPSPSPPVLEQHKKSTRPKVREVEPPELIDISAVSSGVEPQNEEVWSPKLESSKGLVSIERVTARTLQTIPFSEDPIWKQIEEMTTFDQLLANEALNLQSPSQQAHLHRNSYIDIPSPAYSQTTTVTTNTAIYTPPVTSEPIKTKPFATPKIQPLKLSIKTKSTATPIDAKSSATALDEVLEDVRLSLQRKPGGDSSSSLQSPLYVQPVQQSFPQTYTNNDVSDASFTPSHNRQTMLAKPEANNIYARQSMIDRELEPFMQSLIEQPVQNQPVQNQPVQINPDFTQYPYVINGNYQLDPHLLKEKLMDTGLANLDETLSTRSVTPAYSPAITPLHPRYDHQQQLQQQFQYQQPQQPHNWQQQYQQNHQQPHFQQQQNQPQYQTQQYQQQQQQPQQTYLPQQQQQQPQQTYLPQQQQQTKQQKNKSAAEQICKTMEDLKNLAKEVEMKLSQIKYKIVDADESKLDSIITALKNFSPEPLEKMDTPKVESTAEQTERQRKLSGALAELERIYESLSVCDDSYSEKRPIGQSQSQSHSSSALNSQSVMSSHTIPRQHAIYTDTAHSQSRNNVYGNQPGIRRNKSDSDCTIKNLRGETLAEVERQTQREFDDINRSFQTLLAEVNQHSGSKPSVSKPKTSHTAEIEETIDSLLRDLQKAADNRSSSQPVSKSTSSSRLTESLIDDLVNKQITTQNTCREIRKSEVFTTSSGPFSVLVGINGSGRKPYYTGKNKAAYNEQFSKEVKPYTQSEQDDVFTTDNKGINNGPSKPKTKSSKVQIKLKKDLANRNEKKHFGSRQEDCDSEDSEEGQKVYRRSRRQGNLQHRKSMPADILKKSVETQTFEDYTPVAEIREKFQSKSGKGKSDSTGNEESSSSETFSGEAKGPRKRKISKGIAEKMEIFSSSDDERSKQFPLVHSHSAPDLTELFKGDKNLSKSSKTKKIRSPRFVKQRNERARKKSSQSSKDDSTEEKEFSVTSATSDDGQMSQGSKPPVHPGRKQRSSSPDKVFSDSSRSENRAFFAVKKGSQVETRDFGKTERRPDACGGEVVLRKKAKKETRDDSPERPHSFHELLAAFETDPNHLNKLCYALRKCASADCVSGETMLKKCYHSEPDLRDDILGSNVSKGLKDVKLQVEVKIKQ
ncbi:hypothetical protein KUTeg_001444 [Tegillarca granosa]|uniref:Uncharacterized protein n=1 Tax=Tegillarca granosa TaxID=220873 RepID=A0ABQ9FV59_TEGGR|nr:hypothetical protein KUTeg_001444 [Tegillarca granosa]